MKKFLWPVFFPNLILVAPWIWNQRGRISWNIAIMDDIVFFEQHYSDRMCQLHTAINILQYLKHCQWGLKLLHHPHHSIPRTNQLLDVDIFCSFRYDLSSSVLTCQDDNNGQIVKIGKIHRTLFPCCASPFAVLLCSMGPCNGFNYRKVLFFVSFSQENMTRCQIWCTIEFHRDPISRVLSEW